MSIQKDPVAKLIFSHMKYANSFEPADVVINGEEMFYTAKGEEITEKELQKRCEAHMSRTVAKIKKVLT